MGKDESIVKSFRIPERQFEQANEIFKKEGFSFSEVIRLMCDAAIREGRIPRGLSTKEIEPKLDSSQARENYIDGVLQMAGIVPKKMQDISPKERLLKALFEENRSSSELSNREIREWGEKWGLPDELSIGTLAELRDLEVLPRDPWDGAYKADIQPAKYCGNGETEIDENLQNALVIMKFGANLRDNLEQVRRKLETKAMKYLLELDNVRNDKEEETDD